MDPKHERAPSSDPTLIRSVFERAIASCSRGAFAAETSLTRLPKPKKKGKHKTDPNQDERQLLEQTFAAYKDTEANLWTRYGGWERWNESVTRRATRACPQKGSLWAHRCNQLVSRLDSKLMAGNVGGEQRYFGGCIRTGTFSWHGYRAWRHRRHIYSQGGIGQP